MKIGILTFHWATNYGAVLQCYALQEYLKSLGHEVEVINYKPSQYDESLYKFLRYRKFFHIKEYVSTLKMEKELVCFRDNHLNMTNRVFTCDSMASVAAQYDVIISGSDQVLNPSFLMGGEGAHRITPTYFLDFPFEGKRVGYALSFGCVSYPEQAMKEARRHINVFDHISVRESSGIRIVAEMGRKDTVVVSDPTLLMSSSFYHSLADEGQVSNDERYIYSFFIRHIAERKCALATIFSRRKLIWNNEDGSRSVQNWLYKIKQAEFVVTDSFHCMVMCLKLHKPFAVVTELEGNVGMNDRLYTLLSRMGMKKCIVHKHQCHAILTMSDDVYDWRIVDNELEKLRVIGQDYLFKYVN